MKYPFGTQYSKDDEFKAKARLHQSKYRAENLQVVFDEYGNRLTKHDAVNYLNFHSNLGVVETLTSRYPQYSKGLYADMLRSEHIPFNIFAPLKQDLHLAKKAFNQLLNGVEISAIDKIEFEFAPNPASEFLNDRTSFDVYVEFTTNEGEKGFLGIEVKYTEHEYKLKKGSKEDIDINNSQSAYNQVSKQQGLFVPNVTNQIKSDCLRQIWRNHLLCESMLIHPKLHFKHFISVILYPAGNKHFTEVIPEYQSCLTPENRNKLQGITFETFFAALESHNSNKDFGVWINYLKSRYLV